MQENGKNIYYKNRIISYSKKQTKSNFKNCLGNIFFKEKQKTVQRKAK